jgi:hypothetical protein
MWPLALLQHHRVVHQSLLNPHVVFAPTRPKMPKHSWLVELPLPILNTPSGTTTHGLSLTADKRITLSELNWLLMLCVAVAWVPSGKAGAG